jgi:hypothetical protein
MLTPTNHCAAPPASSATPQAETDVPLRDLVYRHASELERLLEAHVQRIDPGLARAFGQQAQSYRELGRAKFSSWLYGATLRLLRDSVAAGLAGQPDFALRFLGGFPQPLARPMITLALSSVSYVACAIYLCKPACAALRDISLPADWEACVARHQR